jgi:hypothetical protein
MLKLYRIKLFLSFIFLLLCGIFIWQYVLNTNIDADIKAGNMQYVTCLGWVNWEHANPTSTKAAFTQLQQLNTKATDSFTFQYFQKMKVKFGGNQIVANCSQTRTYMHAQTEAQLQLFFLQIFASVSTDFEKMQAQFPNAKRSSFREGDLMGNLISYYAATHHLPISELKTRLQLYTIAESLAIAKAKKPSKENWQTMHIDACVENKTVIDLKNILATIQKFPTTFDPQWHQTSAISFHQ